EKSFDLAVTRVAAHHFSDVAAAVRELARVASQHLIVVDNRYMGAHAEEAEKIRDASHVRNYSEEQWRGYLSDAALEVDEVRTFDFPIEFEPWLERTACTGAAAERVRELMTPHLADGMIALERIALLAHPA